MKIYCSFPGGEGVQNKKPFVGGGSIFLELHIKIYIQSLFV